MNLLANTQVWVSVLFQGTQCRTLSLGDLLPHLYAQVQQQNLQEQCKIISVLPIATKLTASGFKEIDLATVLTKELSLVTNDEWCILLHLVIRLWKVQILDTEIICWTEANVAAFESSFHLFFFPPSFIIWISSEIFLHSCAVIEGTWTLLFWLMYLFILMNSYLRNIEAALSYLSLGSLVLCLPFCPS